MVRITLDPRPYLEVILNRANPPVLFTAYGFVTLSGGFLLGMALLQSRLARRLGHRLTSDGAVLGVASAVTSHPGVVGGPMMMFCGIEAGGIRLPRRPAARIAPIQQQVSA